MANEPSSSVSTPDKIAHHLAANLVALRQKRNLTQSGLANLAKIPRSTLAHFESGEGNPSLLNLSQIAGALQITIEELLTRPRAQCKLIKSNQMPSVKRSQGMAQVFKLLPDPIPGMEIDRLEIEEGGRMGGVPHVAGTKEYLTVIQGEITVQVAGDSYPVSVGDVFAFPGDQAHSYRNTGAKKAIGFSVVTLAPAGK